MPALPGPYLVLVHSRFTLAAFKAGFNARSRFDDVRQFSQGRFRQGSVGHTRWGQIVAIPIAGILIAGIWRGLPLQRALVREGTPRDHQPLFGSRAFAFEPRLHASFDHLNAHRPFLSVSHRQVGPCSRIEGVAPARHRLPRRLRWSAAPRVHWPWGLQVAYGGVAGYPQYIALAPLTQLLAKPGVATQLIITCHPAVRHLRTPQVEHLQALLVTRVIRHGLGHVACLASVLVSCPLLRQGQAEVEQGMVVARDVPHEDPHLAVVDFAAVAAPLALHTHRMSAPLREAAGIKGDNAIGLAQASGHLTN